MQRRPILVLYAAIAIVAAGCGLSGEQPPNLAAKDIPARLGKISSAPGGDRVYFLGETFETLALTAAEFLGGNGIVFFAYGTCRGAGEGRCSPPVQVQNQPWDDPWDQVRGCVRLPPVRGVPAVQWGGGLTLLTGQPLWMIHIFARTEAEELRAAAALRRVAGGPATGNLPLPSRSQVAAIGKACGASAGESGPGPFDE